MNIQLTTNQEKQAVELFAQGLRRPEVVSHLIDNDPDLMQATLDNDEADVRKYLSDKLRSCDPTSTQFAITKHGDHYETHRSELIRTLGKYYETMVTKSIKSLEDYIQDLDDRAESLQHNLDSAMETTPVGAGEFLSTHNMLLTIEKRKMEVLDKFIERLERINNLPR